MRTPIDPRYLFIKYTLEFFVVVIGISVSFWLSEWNEQRKLDTYHIEDSHALLEDLQIDLERLENVNNTIIHGKLKASRLLNNIDSFREGNLSYKTFSDSIIAIGYIYTYATFFMNNSTYKSMINNGRILRFPQNIEKHIKDYYEYVSKRVEDNNRLVDNLAFDYYSIHHPYCLRVSDVSRELTSEERLNFFRQLDMKASYSSIDFYKASIALYNKIHMHGRQINRYTQMRNHVDSLIQEHVDLIE